jgi:hypothetical protein
MCLFAGACSGSDTNKYSGVLYYGWGQQLNSMDLATHKRAVLYVDPDHAIMSVTKLDLQRFMFGSNSIAFSTWPIVQTFDRSTGKVSALYSYNDGKQSDLEGQSFIQQPIYLAKHSAIVFHGANDHKGGIYWASIATPSKQHLVEDNVSVIYSLVPISDDEVVFYDGERPKLFNIKTGVLSDLNITECVPYLWRSRTQQLLCSKGDSFNYFLTNLDGSEREALNIGENHVPLYYIDQLDAAIFNGTELGLKGKPHEVGTLSFYDFDKKSMNKVVGDAMVGVGAVIWYPN